MAVGQSKPRVVANIHDTNKRGDRALGAKFDSYAAAAATSTVLLSHEYLILLVVHHAINTIHSDRLNYIYYTQLVLYKYQRQNRIRQTSGRKTNVETISFRGGGGNTAQPRVKNFFLFSFQKAGSLHCRWLCLSISGSQRWCCRARPTHSVRAWIISINESCNLVKECRDNFILWIRVASRSFYPVLEKRTAWT